MNKNALLIIISLLPIAIVVLGIYVYQVNRPSESKITYHLPKRTQSPKIITTIGKPKPPSTPADKKPKSNVTEETFEPDDMESDTELEEFLALLTEVGELEELEDDEERPKELLELTPDEMIGHLKENYHPADYMVFLSSGTGLQWARTVLAPNFPRLDDPFVTACKDIYSNDAKGYAICVEDRYAKLVADSGDAYINGYNNIMNFIDKLQPTPLVEGGASVSIIPAREPPEPRTR